jgi:AbrB family looped-hinge helix DNA binding protein
METTRLSSKGQVIIPKALRDAHAWLPGLEFVVIDTAEGLLLRPKRPFAPTTIADVAGCLPFEGEARSVEEMDEAIDRAVREKWHDRN